MSDIRFGLIIGGTGLDWAARARQAEQRGYHTVLLPDTLFTPSPFPTLAAAAALTEHVRLRPNVLAAPLRSPGVTVREAATLQLLSGGRFELGIGAGRPGADAEAARLGMPWGTATQRRQQLIEVATAVRAEVAPPPPIVVAASGARMLTAATGFADRILLATGPAATDTELARLAGVVHDRAGRRVPLTQQVVGIGDRLPSFTARRFGLTADQLRGAAGMLAADPGRAADEVLNRAARLGVDELLVPDELIDAVEPIVARLQR